MNELALFAGAGGGILGGKLLGWRTVCAVEIDPYARAVLASRQNDKTIEPFPIWDDVVTFDGRPWRGLVDVVSGGFPCQDISVAGTGKGIGGERSGLWKEMFRIICEVRPRYVFVENSPALTSRGLGTVLGDLASVGFDAKWGVLGAHHVGAPHNRNRIWIVANANSERRGQEQVSIKRSQDPSESRNDGTQEPLANTECQGLEGHFKQARKSEVTEFGHVGWWETEPDVGRVVDGLANRVDRLKCLGNGQVPAVAAAVFKILS